MNKQNQLKITKEKLDPIIRVLSLLTNNLVISHELMRGHCSELVKKKKTNQTKTYSSTVVINAGSVVASITNRFSNCLPKTWR